MKGTRGSQAQPVRQSTPSDSVAQTVPNASVKKKNKQPGKPVESSQSRPSHGFDCNPYNMLYSDEEQSKKKSALFEKILGTHYGETFWRLLSKESHESSRPFQLGYLDATLWTIVVPAVLILACAAFGACALIVHHLRARSSAVSLLLCPVELVFIVCTVALLATIAAVELLRVVTAFCLTEVLTLPIELKQSFFPSSSSERTSEHSAPASSAP